MTPKEDDLIMTYMCKDCYKSFQLHEVYHLKSGDFLCEECLVEDEKIRKDFHFPANKLMISPGSKNKELI